VELANSVVDRGKGWPSHVPLSLAPKLVILDEALSGLDCSVRAQIANLFDGVAIVLRTDVPFYHARSGRWPRTWVMKSR